MGPHGVCHDLCLVSTVSVGSADMYADLVRLSFLLLAGRLADLYPAQFVFEGGFVTLAIFFLVSSFGGSDLAKHQRVS